MAKHKPSKPLSRRTITRLESHITTASEQIANLVPPKRDVANNPFVVARVTKQLFDRFTAVAKAEYPDSTDGDTHPYAISMQKGMLIGYVLSKQLFPSYRTPESLDKEVTETLDGVQNSPYGIDYTFRLHGRHHLEKFSALISSRLQVDHVDPESIMAQDRQELYLGALGYVAAIGVNELFLEELKISTGNLGRREAKRMAAEADAWAFADISEADIEAIS